MIDVKHLTRTYGQHLAVDDISFELQQGEVVGFLGPNGAGKTTTMRMLTGYLPASHAERMMVAGFDVLRESMEVRRRIGYLPESVPLYGELRVREMMSFQGRLHRMSRQDLKKRIPEVLERVGVLDRERQLVGKLSRGLRQRVGLAIALLPKPEVLILDEPTSGLDPLQRREVRGLIRELADDHTVLLSSHILAEIESICPRVIILERGRKVADGNQQELVESLGGTGFVRFEAMVGDSQEAAELIASLPGVSDVQLGEKVGIHQGFEVRGSGDLREDLGALAMARTWAIRELSWSRPTLEEIFVSLVVGGELRSESKTGAPAAEGAAAGTAAAEDAATPSLGSLPMQIAGMPAPAAFTSPGDDPPLGTPGRKKTIYSLNPFDQGAGRNLGKPMDIEPVPSVDVALSANEPERCVDAAESSAAGDAKQDVPAEGDGQNTNS
ncbi:MAG: ABC-2 type transport system ATP-binding protein [Planctomycetota bacterium]|jgi:ABC-2 type transport system ATP-binding protein